MKNKLSSYNEATQELMRRADKLDVRMPGELPLSEMVCMLRESFKYKLTYKKVFGVIFKDINDVPPPTDYCKVASYYIYTKARDAWNIKETPLHWWLEHKATGEIFDITCDQFSEPFPYHLKPVAEPLLGRNEEFTDKLRASAIILGKCAGIE
jgi:hypothetical protein